MAGHDVELCRQAAGDEGGARRSLQCLHDTQNGSIQLNSLSLIRSLAISRGLPFAF